MLILIQRKWMPFAVALVLLVTSSMSSAMVNAADYTVVVIKSQDAVPYNEALEGFKESLHNTSAQANCIVRSFNVEDSMAFADIEATVKLKPDLIFTLGTSATKLAAEKTSAIPILSGMIMESEALKNTANITGIFLEYSIETQFDWMKRFLPDANTIGVIYNPENNQTKVDEAEVWAVKSGFNLISEKISSPREIPSALERLSKRVDVLLGIPDKMVYTQQTAKQILLFSFRNRIPFIGFSSSWVKAGALYALDWNYRDIGRECGDRAVRILQGKKANSSSPNREKSVSYSLNLKAAERMKIDFPEELVKAAKNIY
jgi:putative ABC transport system substrate-binding protein